MAKQWVMTPARKAYYESRRKGKGKMRAAMYRKQTNIANAITANPNISPFHKGKNLTKNARKLSLAGLTPAKARKAKSFRHLSHGLSRSVLSGTETSARRSTTPSWYRKFSKKMGTFGLPPAIKR
jgi:hypothetical protein